MNRFITVPYRSWALRELGMTAAAAAGLFGITQQAVAKAFVQGEEFADAQRYKLRSSQTKRAG